MDSADRWFSGQFKSLKLLNNSLALEYIEDVCIGLELNTIHNLGVPCCCKIPAGKAEESIDIRNPRIICEYLGRRPQLLGKDTQRRHDYTMGFKHLKSIFFQGAVNPFVGL